MGAAVGTDAAGPAGPVRRDRRKRGRVPDVAFQAGALGGRRLDTGRLWRPQPLCEQWKPVREESAFFFF